MKHTNSLTSVRINGFSVRVSQHLRDPRTDDLPLLNMYGSPQAVRAVWAKLTSTKTYCWELGGEVRLQKDPGHVLLKTDTPNGWTNWVFISRQAIPKFINPSMPTYCWTTDFNSHGLIEPPESAYSVLMATLPFPMLEEWTKYLWQSGINERLIHELRRPTGVTGFKILPAKEKWAEIIKKGFDDQQIYIKEPVVEPKIEQKPYSDQDYFQPISVYSRKDALLDELQYDANIEPFADVTKQHYKWPVYMSKEVYWLMKESVETEGNYTDFKGIWHDILNMSLVLYEEIDSRTKTCSVYVRMENGLEELQHFTFEFGPFDYDDPTPCVYVRLSSEID